MPIPKIIFYHSYIYEFHLKRSKKVKGYDFNKAWDETRKFAEVWKKYERSVLRELEKITGLKWQEKDIVVYTTYGVGSFSSPLTISLRKDYEYLVDILVHELIHRIVSGEKNYSLIRKQWEAMMTKYSKESLAARGHVPIHAIHKHIFLKLFNKKRLQHEIDLMKRTAKDYARAWEIVERDGYNEIIAQIRYNRTNAKKTNLKTKNRSTRKSR